MMQLALLAAASRLPDPEEIRRAAREVVGRPEYELGPVRETSSAFQALMWKMLQWILKPIFWLFESLSGLPEFLRWLIVIGLVVLLIAICVHIVYTFVKAFRGPKREHSFTDKGSQTVRDPHVWERQAEEAIAAHDYIGAIRLLFRACLLRLELSERRRFRPGVTNREHLRRYRSTPLFESICLFVETIDVKWYGGGVCSVGDCEACVDAHRRIRQLTKETAHAHSA